MMSLQTIQALSRERAILSAQAKEIPFYFWDNDLEKAKRAIDSGHPPECLQWIPNIGSYDPPGYELVNTHFVDSSGFGSEDEPALTIAAFVHDVLNTSNSFAIVETGQFQIYIGEFCKIK